MFGRSLCDEVLSIIKRWTPKKKYTRETEYSDELAEFIRKKLKESQQGILFGCPEEHYVKREGGRSRADIEVDGRIGIELKRNLKGKTEMNRLMGQLSDYEDEYRCIIVVLCGEVREETVDELKYKVKKKYGTVSISDFGFVLQKPRVEIVIKGKSQLRRKRKATKKTKKTTQKQRRRG